MTAYEETLRFCNEKLEKEVAALKAQIKKLQLELQKANEKI
jgi:predicted  nucleic acid-binding Zn-ribbon protein